MQPPVDKARIDLHWLCICNPLSLGQCKREVLVHIRASGHKGPLARQGTSHCTQAFAHVLTRQEAQHVGLIAARYALNSAGCMCHMHCQNRPALSTCSLRPI